jgi:hypothetical protein
MCSKVTRHEHEPPSPQIAAVLTRAIDELAAAASAGDDAEMAAQLASAWAMVAAADPELAARAERYSAS